MITMYDLSSFLNAGLISDLMMALAPACSLFTSVWLKLLFVWRSLNGLKRTDSSTPPVRWLSICPGTA